MSTTVRGEKFLHVPFSGRSLTGTSGAGNLDSAVLRTYDGLNDIGTGSVDRSVLPGVGSGMTIVEVTSSMEVVNVLGTFGVDNNHFTLFALWEIQHGAGALVPTTMQEKGRLLGRFAWGDRVRTRIDLTGGTDLVCVAHWWSISGGASNVTVGWGNVNVVVAKHVGGENLPTEVVAPDEVAQIHGPG